MDRGRPEEWTPERIAELKLLLGNPSLSMAQIGKEMGLSRNAIIGKVHRLGLTGRPPKPARDISEHARLRNERRARAERARKQKRREREREQKMRESDLVEHFEEAPVVNLVPEIAVPAGDRIPTADLPPFSNKHQNRCRYIADEPPGPLYLACGTLTDPGKAYCPACWRITHGNNSFGAIPMRKAA